VPVGISDHSLSGIVPVVATSVGASIVEKHFTFSRSIAGPDSSFSLEPQEFEEMVRAITNAKITLGKVKYGPMKLEQQSYHNRRSLYVVHDIRKGEIFSELNVRSIRPGFGLPPKKLFTILGKKSKFDIKKGTPLTERLIR
jgi:N-acetylneuraminate synthase